LLDARKASLEALGETASEDTPAPAPVAVVEHETVEEPATVEASAEEVPAEELKTEKIPAADETKEGSPITETSTETVQQPLSSFGFMSQKSTDEPKEATPTSFSAMLGIQ
jgi:hypothetical protein